MAGASGLVFFGIFGRRLLRLGFFTLFLRGGHFLLHLFRMLLIIFDSELGDGRDLKLKLLFGERDELCLVGVLAALN